MSDFKAKMHQIRFRLDPAGSLQRSPRPLAGFKGPTSKGGGDGRAREGGRGAGGREGRECCGVLKILKIDPGGLTKKYFLPKLLSSTPSVISLSPSPILLVQVQVLVRQNGLPTKTTKFNSIGNKSKSKSNSFSSSPSPGPAKWTRVQGRTRVLQACFVAFELYTRRIDSKPGSQCYVTFDVDCLGDANFSFFYRATLCVSAVVAVARCLSVTFVYCIQMAEDIVKLLSQPSSF